MQAVPGSEHAEEEPGLASNERPAPARPPLRFGLLKGRFSVPADFDAADPEIEALFEDGEIMPPRAG